MIFSLSSCETHFQSRIQYSGGISRFTDQSRNPYQTLAARIDPKTRNRVPKPEAKHHRSNLIAVTAHIRQQHVDSVVGAKERVLHQKWRQLGLAFRSLGPVAGFRV